VAPGKKPSDAHAHSSSKETKPCRHFEINHAKYGVEKLTFFSEGTPNKAMSHWWSSYILCFEAENLAKKQFSFKVFFFAPWSLFSNNSIHSRYLFV